MDDDERQNVTVNLSGLPQGIELIDVVFKDQVGDPLREVASAISAVADALNRIAGVLEVFQAGGLRVGISQPPPE